MMSRYPDVVDIVLINDTGTDTRMGREATTAQQTIVAAGVRCRVNERDPDRATVFSREATIHTHRVHFRSDPGATVAHVLHWTPTDQDYVVTLQVKGTKRPRFRGMPWVVLAQEFRAGPQS